MQIFWFVSYNVYFWFSYNILVIKQIFIVNNYTRIVTALIIFDGTVAAIKVSVLPKLKTEKIDKTMMLF